MHPDKSSGPDVFNLAFYHKFWPLIGKDIFQTCSTWLHTGEFPKAFNETIITLIPKVDRPATMADFRRILLCNVLYNIISQVLANRI